MRVPSSLVIGRLLVPLGSRHRRRGRSAAFGAALVSVVVALAAVVAAPAGAAAGSTGAAAAPVPSTLGLWLGATSVTYGTRIAVTARLTTAAGPVAGATVTLRKRRVGETAFTVVRSLTTDSAGVARTSVRPLGGATFDVVFAGSATVAPSRSVVRSVTVRHAVTASAAKSARTASVFTVRGTVAPARPGSPVRLARWRSGRWVVEASTTRRADGSYAVSVRTPSSRGFLHYRVQVPASGSVAAATLRLPRVDNYSLHTYVVRSRGTITVSMADFAARAGATYADTRGWRGGHHRFARVSSGGSFTLVLSEAKYLPTYSSVCSVLYSCRVGRYVIINQDRWRGASPAWTASLTAYRQMVLNHETGHWLGRGHAYCGGSGQLAPVMQQQSKSLQGCRPNAWPLAWELRAVT